jgi:hypothetical protein
MGRPKNSNRRILEYSYGIGIKDLAASGALTGNSGSAHACGKLILSDGREARDIAAYSLTVEISEGPGPYTIQFENNYEGKHYTDEHTIENQAVNLGGYRYYFRCAHCDRRVKALFFNGPLWGCRHCCGLLYQREKEHRLMDEYLHAAEILRTKARKLRKNRHPRLANRLERQAVEYEEKRDQRYDEYWARQWGNLAEIFKDGLEEYTAK